MPITIIVKELSIVYTFDMMKWEEESFKEELYMLVARYKGKPKQYPQ